MSPIRPPVWLTLTAIALIGVVAEVTEPLIARIERLVNG